MAKKQGTIQVDAGEGPLKTKVPAGKAAPMPKPRNPFPKSTAWLGTNSDKPRSA